MPRRSLLSAMERAALLAFPTTDEALIRHYTFTEPDLAAIRQRRGSQNRLGFAVQLCYLRYPGFALPTDAEPPPALLALVARQLCVDPAVRPQYGQRAETRREHLAELQAWLNLTPFGRSDYRRLVRQLAELAQQTDRGIVLATALVEAVRAQRIIMPAVDVIERVCAEALSRGTRQVYEALTAPLSDQHRRALEGLLTVRDGTKASGLTWLRQPPGAPNARHVLVHIKRLKVIRDLGLPDGLGRAVHQNRLLKLAREGGQMTAQHLRDLESKRRCATLVALILDTRATLIDEIIDLHDRIMGTLFNRAKRYHAERFQQAGKTINDKVRLYSRIGRALLEAKQTGGDPFAAIEAILPWERFSESVTEAETLAQPEDFDYLSSVDDGFSQLRRYTPALLAALDMKAAPAARDVLEAVDVLKGPVTGSLQPGAIRSFLLKNGQQLG
jgi:hypothetical protein